MPPRTQPGSAAWPHSCWPPPAPVPQDRPEHRPALHYWAHALWPSRRSTIMPSRPRRTTNGHPISLSSSRPLDRI